MPAAQAEFERLAADDFAGIPRDSLWQTCICYLAEVCGRLQDEKRATMLYGLLLPYADLTVVVGNATVCLGATSRFLGQLAAVLGRWDTAEAHFEHALRLNARMDAGHLGCAYAVPVRPHAAAPGSPRRRRTRQAR